jgi:dTDP-4-amino-4,6-dideoxygalactose transaminase
MINLFQAALGDEELAAVQEVFRSGWIGRGPRTDEFVAAFGEHVAVEAEHLVAVNSCTEGLFLAMELLDVGPGTEVVLPTVSFVGAANAVASRGARPVFCDVDPRTLNPTVDDVVARITRRTKAVVVLHYGGHPGDVADIAGLCREHGIALVEDTACAVASRVGERSCGTFGDIGVWSFDAMKVLVAGDGGMLFCRDGDLAARAAQLGYLGLTHASGWADAGHRDRWWEFEVTSPARRSIMGDLNAAIGNVQLRRLPALTARRRAIADRYDQELPELSPVRCPPRLPEGHSSSYFFYWVQVEPEVRDRLAHLLLDRGVYTTFRYLPLHQRAIYGSEAALPRAEAAAARTLCLPTHNGLDDAAVDQVIDAMRGAIASLTLRTA